MICWTVWCLRRVSAHTAPSSLPPTSMTCTPNLKLLNSAYTTLSRSPSHSPHMRCNERITPTHSLLSLQVVNAIRYIGLDYDIQAIDITDPNPVALMMLSVYLYQKLPLYLPKSTITFTGPLHHTVQRQVSTGEDKS